MCGIFGMLGKRASVRSTLRALSVQHHRGPDDTGYVEIAEGPLCLGHNRLSVIDTSSLGHQPMMSADGHYWIVFNGEVYNYLELRAQLADYPFRSKTDTEVILAAYARWGFDCVKQFVGMFAFALWDGKNRELMLVRDRLGIKPLNYCYVDDTLVFGSEIKSILSTGVKAAPDVQTWSDYLNHGIYEQHDRTFFDGISQVPAGCIMRCRPGGHRTTARYWDLRTKVEEIESESRAQADNFRELEALMHTAVSSRLRSDVPLGVNVSGGLDSMLLASIVEDVSGGQEELYAATAGFTDPQYDERGYAREVLTSERWKRIETAEEWTLLSDTARVVLSHQEAPVGGVSTLAYHKLHAAIRSAGLVVQLEGQGLDELFAGYAYYRDIIDDSSFNSWLSSGTYQDGTQATAKEMLSRSIRTDVPLWKWRVPRIEDPLNRALFVDITQKKIPRVLRMNDRLSMAYGVELRVPFLDHRLVEEAFRIPGILKREGGVSKRPLRTIAQRIRPNVPSAQLEKRSNVSPQTRWLREECAGFVHKCIESPWFRESGFYDIDLVRERFDKFIEKGASNSFFVWQWVNTALWFELFIGEGWRKHADMNYSSLVS